MSTKSSAERHRALRFFTALQLIVFMIVLAVPVAALAADPSAAATIQSDKADYPPAGHVILTGANWLPGEDVNILVDDLDAHSWQYTATVAADVDGNIANEFDLPNLFVANYSVTADGATSGFHADWAFTDAIPKADLDSCANDAAPSPPSDGCTANGDWVNGNLVANKANYFEGNSVPFRVKMSNVGPGTHTFTLTWDTTKGGNHTFDYLTTYTQTVTTANACAGQTCGIMQPFGAATAIPADPQVTGAGVTPIAGNFSMWGAVISGISAYSGGAGFPGGDNDRSITITFSPLVSNPVLAFGVHIASRDDWGEFNAAASVPGSPYHVESGGVDGQGGKQSHQIKLGAITFPGSITIIKDATPNSAQSFAYTASPAPLAAFNLVDNGTSSNTKVFSDIADFKTYLVNESPLPSGWNFDSVSCSVTSENGGSSSTSGTTATINLEEGENWTCTYLNSATNLKLVKSVTNNNGGNNAADGWTLSAVAASPNNTRNFSNLGGSGTFTPVFPGVQYTLSESPNPGTGYTSTGIWSCSAGGTFVSPNKITVPSGVNVTCTINNDDVAPTLALNKTVVNHNNGQATEEDFVLSATPTSGTTITDAGGDVPATTAQANVVYTLSETGVAGYTPSLWTCTGTGVHQTNNTVTLDEGAVASCAITNTDDPASLTLIKHVVKDNGGTASASAWTLHAGANAVAGSEAGIVATTQAGTYALSETGGVSGYTNTLISCSDNPGVAVTSVTITLGQSKTCTFVNDDDAAKLTLIKQVVKDNGGNANPSAWTLHAGAHAVAGSLAGNVATTQAGTYALSETGGVSGYTNTSITCDDNPNVEVTSVTIGLGETKSCTFVNDDQPGTLIVKKLVINDDTGISIASDFGFKVNGGSTTSFIQDGADTLKGKNTLTLDAGTYTVTEPAFTGYSTTYSNCSNIVVGNGETKTCTVTNYDDTTVEDDVIDPHGSIFGPCGDPSFAGVFDNTDSTVKIRFKFTWRTTKGLNKIVKMVPSGAIYHTVLRWGKPGSQVRVLWQNPDTGVWTILATQTVVKGRYGTCSEWVPGWTYAP